MTLNRLMQLSEFGQSHLVRQYSPRPLLRGSAAPAVDRGGRIERDDLQSNHLRESHRGNQQDIRRLAADGSGSTEILQSLVPNDVCCAADGFRSVYEATGGADGFVPMEGPYLAHDTEGSIAEARALW
jgi:transaldolase